MDELWECATAHADEMIRGSPSIISAGRGMSSQGLCSLASAGSANHSEQKKNRVKCHGAFWFYDDEEKGEKEKKWMN